MRSASRRWRASARTSAGARSPASGREVVHAHDWQAALAPAYLHYAEGPRPGTVITIHNLAFQGHFPARSSASSACRRTRSPSTASNITTASATSRPACGLPTASPPCRRPMRARSGRPRAAWGSTGCCARAPRSCRASSTASTTRSGIRRPTQRCRKPIARCASTCGRATRPRCRRGSDCRRGSTGRCSASSRRLTWQKGLDLLLQALPGVIAKGGQLALLGSGEPALEAGFAAAAAARPGPRRLRSRL